MAVRSLAEQLEKAHKRITKACQIVQDKTAPYKCIAFDSIAIPYFYLVHH